MATSGIDGVSSLQGMNPSSSVNSNDSDQDLSTHIFSPSTATHSKYNFGSTDSPLPTPMAAGIGFTPSGPGTTGVNGVALQRLAGMKHKLDLQQQVPSDLCFYVTYQGLKGSYTHRIEFKTDAQRQEVEAIYLEILNIINGNPATTGKEIDSVDFMNGLVYLKGQREPLVLDDNPDLSKRMRKVFESAMPKGSTDFKWPEFHALSAGHLNGESWYQNSTPRLERMKTMTRDQFLDNKVVQEKLKNMDPNRRAERLYQLWIADQYLKESDKKLKKLHADYGTKLSQLPAEDPGIQALSQARAENENLQATLNGVDRFAFFYAILADETPVPGATVQNMLDQANAREKEIGEIIKAEKGDRFAEGMRKSPAPLELEEEKKAKSMAIASRMTDRHNCRILCAAMKVPVRQDPLEWQLSHHLFHSENPDDFFAHPKIENMVNALNAHTDDPATAQQGMGRDFQTFTKSFITEAANYRDRILPRNNAAPAAPVITQNAHNSQLLGATGGAEAVQKFNQLLQTLKPPPTLLTPPTP